MNLLWLVFFWQEECQTKCQETYEEHQNIEDIKECEDKDGYKGGGFV